MNNLNAEMSTVEIAGAIFQENQFNVLSDYALYVGLDVHKETIAIAYAYPGRSEPLFYGEIPNDSKKLKKVLAKLSEDVGGGVLQVCYEAGPTGFVTYRQILSMGHDAMVVAPSLIPHKPGDLIKTDKRDALKLARSLRSGDLTQVWVPDEVQEGFRDLSRTREDLSILVKTCKQRLNGFVLRHGHKWPKGRTKWTLAHRDWLERLTFSDGNSQRALSHYLKALDSTEELLRVAHNELMAMVDTWNMKPIVDSLVALRGIDRLTAVTLMAELGDLSRFSSPKQLMAYLGLVPSEHSSGGSRSQGKITKMGNGHARRVLVESAWSYRFFAKETRHLKTKAETASPYAKEVGWKAQKRLCGRYRILQEHGKCKNVTVVAIARELSGFIWDIANHELEAMKRTSAS